VAYSVFGTVRSINGEPEKNVIVEAIQVVDTPNKERRYEETVTDNNGDYRLRGLIPTSRYRISLKISKPQQNEPATDSTSNSNVDTNTNAASTNATTSTIGAGASRMERCSPSYVDVIVNNFDVRNINFYAFRKLSKYDITGSIKASSEWIGTLEVLLASASSPSTVIKSMNMIKNLNFFEFGALPEDTYIVSLRSSLSSRTHTIISPPVTVVFQQQHVHVRLHFEAQLKPLPQDLTQGSFLSLLFATVIVAVFYYRKELLNHLNNRNISSSTSTPTEEDDKKKKKKTKKT